MDIVFESDSHIVKTTKALKPDINGELGFSEDAINGTYFVGEGCWGAPTRNNDDDKEWTLASGSFNQVKWVFVDCEKIELRTIMTDDIADITPLKNQFDVPSNMPLWNPIEIGEVLMIEKQVLSSPEVLKNKISMFPNPMGKVLNFVVPTELNEGVIRILDINGRIVLKEVKKIKNRRFTLDTAAIKSGIYFLTISTVKNEVLATKKLLKQ
jgi:hypothetical protein